MRAPEAPIGWPSATAPPCTLTFFGSSPSSWLLAMATTANASLISQRSIVVASQLRLAERALDGDRRRGGEPLGRLRAPAPCATNAAPAASQPRACATSAPQHDQRRGAVVDRRRVAGGDRAVLLERRLAATGSSRCRRAPAPRRCSTLLAAPLRCGTSTATISSLNAPAFCAASARLKLSMAYASCARAIDLLLLRAQLGGVAHVEVVVHVPQAVVDHAVDDGLVAHAHAGARRRQVVRHVRHRLHAAGDDDVGVAGRDRLRAPASPPSSPEPHTLLIVVHGTSLGSPAKIAAWRAGAWPTPAGSTQPMNTSLTSSGDAPARSSASAIATLPELGRLERRQLTQEAADRRSRRTDDHDFAHDELLPRGITHGLTKVNGRDRSCSDLTLCTPDDTVQEMPSSARWLPPARRVRGRGLQRQPGAADAHPSGARRHRRCALFRARRRPAAGRPAARRRQARRRPAPI